MMGASETSRTKVIHTEMSGEGYYAWQSSQVAVRGGTLILVTKPGVIGYGDLDMAAVLLAENITPEQGDVVLDMQCGAGLAGAVAAGMVSEGHVYLVDSNQVAVQAARKTVAANQLQNATGVLSCGTSSLDQIREFDVVTIRIPKSKFLGRQMIWDAFQVLKPGGCLLLAGGKKEGIKSQSRAAQLLFGNLQTLAYRKGFRVGMAIKEQEAPLDLAEFSEWWLDGNTWHQFSVSIGGKNYQVCSRPGVFSWDRLDPGTRVLIDTVEVRDADRVLDLGCGYGIVGAVLAEQAPQGYVMLVDAEGTAVEAAKRTMRANGHQNYQVLLSDCASVVLDDQFDVVVTNPPFHKGKGTSLEVAHQFIRDAKVVLKENGRFFLVANRFIPYESVIREVFGGVDRVYGDNQYKVLKATHKK
jgi:16S rRNA (guanine1207-N2)-methyltransferase